MKNREYPKLGGFSQEKKITEVFGERFEARRTLDFFGKLGKKSLE